VYSVQSFAEYLELVGGAAQMEKLARIELYEAPVELPWVNARAKGGDQ
jgi:hypothetical protein